jgi:regulatory protein
MRKPRAAQLRVSSLRRPARPITAEDLQNAATVYLERYPSTAEGLRRVPQRRVRKAEMTDRRSSTT